MRSKELYTDLSSSITNFINFTVNLTRNWDLISYGSNCEPYKRDETTLRAVAGTLPVGRFPLELDI